MLSVKGFHHAQNVSVSVLSNSDQKEYVLSSEDSYVSKALELSARVPFDIKCEIRSKFLLGNVCNYKNFIENFEDVIYKIYKTHKW